MPPRSSHRPGARAPKPPPTEASLREAAFATLAAQATTVAGLERALARRVATWARGAARAGLDDEAVAEGVARAESYVPGIVARLRQLGLLDDAAYAERRAAGLARSGRSRRAITQDLALKGVPSALARDAVKSDATTELAAAVTLARKRRLGPFARAGDEVDASDRLAVAKAKQRALATLARAGFGFDVCNRVLRMELEEAETLLAEHAPRGW